MVKSIAVYGSCVSRDSYDFLDRSEFELLLYVSRQSILSVDSPADSSYLDSVEMSSKFQLRNSLGDFEGDLWSRLSPVMEKADLLLWDLIDERNGVLPLTSGGLVTYSYDLARAGVFGVLQAQGVYGERIRFGTDEHFELWAAAVRAFLDRAEQEGWREKILFIEAPWAAVTDQGGRPHYWREGPDPESANVLYRRYYDYLRPRLRGVVIPEQAAVTRTDHKWGPGPYHYVDAAYIAVCDAIRTMV